MTTPDDVGPAFARAVEAGGDERDRLLADLEALPELARLVHWGVKFYRLAPIAVAGEMKRAVPTFAAAVARLAAWFPPGADDRPRPVRVTGGSFAGALVTVHFTNAAGLLECRFAEDFGAYEKGEIVVVRPGDVAGQ